MQQEITLVCNACHELFDIEMIAGLNWINRRECFGDPVLCPVCMEELDEEEICNLSCRPI